MKTTLPKATRTVYTILRQIVTMIPREFVRDPRMAEDVFWRLLAHFKAVDPDFCARRYEGYLSRIRRNRVFLPDSSTIRLTLDCFDWARHRRRKAAAKLHMTMELSSRL